MNLRKKRTLESVGGPTYIVDLASHVGSAANIQYHAKILQQKYMARQLISFASKIETSAFDPMVDTDELMQEAEGALFEISRKNMRQDYTQIDPVVRQAVDIIQKRIVKQHWSHRIAFRLYQARRHDIWLAEE